MIEAAVIAVPHPQWQEWPLACAVPKTSVGKFDKKVLRERFKDWKPKA